MTKHFYEYPKADHTTDAVVFGLDMNAGYGKLVILLIRRGREGEPFYDHWALPGGFLEIEKDDDLEECCRRELEEETGLRLSYLEQLATFGKKGRDPRGRVISTAYLGLVRPEDVTVKTDDDAKEATWWAIDQLPPLAFDHAEIIEAGLQRLKSKLPWQPVGIDLLPETFTLRELQTVYEVILGHSIDKRNFYRRVLKINGPLDETPKRRTPDGGGPPAKLYRFNREVYERLQQEGYDFEL